MGNERPSHMQAKAGEATRGARNAAASCKNPIDARTYRLCHLDSQGRVALTETLQATTDRDALAAIKSIHNSHGLELWHGPRWVGWARAKVTKSNKGN